MKKLTFITAFLVLCFTHLTIGQVVTECKGVVNPSNKLWADFSQNASKPSVTPKLIPLNVNYTGLEKKEINATYNDLKSAINELAANKGGVISFKNTGGGKTIFFNEAIEINVLPSRPCVTILIEGNNNVTFSGGGKSSMFIIRKSVKVIMQNITLKDGKLTRQIIQNRNNYRVGGGAVEVTAGAALRVHSCKFLNNVVEEWDDTPGGGYDGVGENQNGAGIRFNYHSTGEVFNTVFDNCKAVTGGAIGATSINKLTIMDCVFSRNTSTAYNTKSSTKRRIVEGAGALRVDRTALPLEIYRTTFKENAANLKASVMEVFIRPLRNNGAETGPYPDSSKFALIIDGCVFENNKYLNFKGASDPERGDFFSGCMVFHGGKTDGNFRGAKMKITNSRFIGNEANESNVRSFQNFEITKTIFANTKFIRLKNKSGKFHIGKGAIALRSEIPGKGIIDQCTFYNNEPNPLDPQNQATVSDVFFWKGSDAKYTLSNSIFYRQTKNTKFKQVSQPMAGSGNNQFIDGVNMTQVGSASRSAVNTTNPNITPNAITNMCLGENTLPNGIGGLADCGSTAPVTTPTPVTPTPTPVPTPTPTPTPITPTPNPVAKPFLGVVTILGESIQSFISSENGTRTLRANRKNAGTTEVFTIKDEGNGKVSIQGNNGKYLSSENGLRPMTCNREQVGAWELFTIVPQANNLYAIQGNTGDYVSHENGREAGIMSNRPNVLAWERFIIKKSDLQRKDVDGTTTNNILVYPNPAKNAAVFVNITTTETVEFSNLEIYDVSGKLLANKNLGILEKGTISILLEDVINTSEIAKGLYIIKVNLEDDSITEKLIID